MYYWIKYREDVTGISEAVVLAGKFLSLEEAQAYYQQKASEWHCENPYFVHLAKENAEGYMCFVGDDHVVYVR